MFITDEEKLIPLDQKRECLYNLQLKDCDSGLGKDKCRKERAGDVHEK